MTVNQTSRAPFRRPVGPGAEGRLRAILGPTNTGKTHLAVERMLAHASGMIGLPLRLLAREIYDKVARQRGAGAVALITGEEKIVPARPHYFVCTVEAMPVDMDVEFLAVDEIQLMADPERGHVFTDRLLNARGRYETLFLGSASAARLVRLLVPAVEIETRARFSQLTHVGARKLSRLPRRSAVVAFSAEAVYVIAELIRRQSGGAAVVMGSLSPRTRNAQVALYQSGEVDFLIATDAIGMGLNMDLGHVAFAGLSKFDGRRTRPLTAQEVAQIAGRAGRHVRDGTFGTTASAPPVDPEMAEAVENHRFEALGFAWWRNAELDFSSLEALSRSLAEPPAREGLRASEEALDERTLSALSADPAVTARATGREALRRLWEVCQTPDFRKTTFEEHRRLAGELFSHLGSRRERIPGEWMAHQLAPLDRLDGGIDALSQRLASGRTLAYAANRPDWVEDAEHWRDLARALEDRLSDALHEKLMAQFVDRRTSALVRGLARGGDLLAGLAADGAVSVEGHYVGHLRGLSFERAGAAEGLARRAIDAAAAKAVGPEVARRLGALAAEPDEGFAVQPDGLLIWRGEAVGVIDRARPLSPTARLFGELGPWQARRRAQTRLDAFLAAEAGRRLAPLQRLQDAVAQGRIRGLARGLAWRLAEAGGVLA
ncbi:MAG: helicase-related protein, partial [Caulobacteraceae bacterium]